MILSILSPVFSSFVKVFRVSASFTARLTNSKRRLSSASTAFLSVRSISACLNGAVCFLPAAEQAAATTCESPSADVETVLITGQPKIPLSFSASVLLPAFSFISLLLSATTTGMPSSKSCVVKNRLRLKLVASTMFIITSGFSFLT